jgi:hypothetical protein
MLITRCLIIMTASEVIEGNIEGDGVQTDIGDKGGGI